MKHSINFKTHAALWTLLGTVCFASAAAMAAKDMGCSPTVANPCSGGSPGGGGPSTPTYDYEAARRAQEAAAERQRQQEEAARIERERQAEEKRKKDAAFIRDRDAAASTLKGSSGGAMNQLKGLAGTDDSGLKGSGFDTSSGLKGLQGSAPVADDRNEPAGVGNKSKSNNKSATSKPLPSDDPKVVDARNVPSGLPKALDNAIASAYSNSPPGVSDRVRKGFQAVMLRDWKVAKAWFQDALNRDPNNLGLKRLVALTDSPQQPNPHARSDSKGASALPNNTKPAPTTRTPLQQPDPKDIYVSFPGLKAAEDKEALEYLFGLNP